MDEMEDNSRYPQKPYPSSSSNRSRKFPLYPHHQHPPVPTHYNRRDYLMDDQNDADEDEDVYQHQQFEGLNDDDEEDDDSGQNDVDEDEDDNYNPMRRGVSGGSYPVNSNSNSNYERYPKRQKKLKSSASNYEFVPRVPPARTPPLPVAEWSEHEKFVLLEVWGDKFLQLGRRSLRSEDWGEVAEKVSEALKVERTVDQCRGMMDVLKRKYKKERVKGGSSKWGYFRKMDMLLGEVGSGSSSGGGVSLGCGVDSGEFVFMDTRVYLERANGNDEMRDSPCGSEGEENGDEEEGMGGCGGGGGVKGLRVLADSVMRFGEIYEKIESSKREQMVELERMRVEFQKEVELQKKLILERAQSEIAKIRGGEGGEEDDEEEQDTDMDDNINGDVGDDDGGGGDGVYDDGGGGDGVYDDGDVSRENANE